jgi:proline iminopeptidase
MPLYPEVAPHSHGLLTMPGDQHVWWEMCGDPHGKPALVLHGGPGSGCQPWHRRLLSPTAYRTILFDQRGCGRSRPHASEPDTSLAGNTTENLIGDIERLREHLGIRKWLVLGGSWGSALALAYAAEFPTRVTELVLFGVTTGRRAEFDWMFREGLGAFFPHAWDRRREALPVEYRQGDVVEAYSRLLEHPDAGVRTDAARAWCLWESATPDWPPAHDMADRFKDPAYAMAFARLVTHYVRHDAWLGDGRILGSVNRFAHLPGVLINGRFDFQAPLRTAYELQRLWPQSTLVVVENAGHAASQAGMTEAIIRATDRFAGQ